MQFEITEKPQCSIPEKNKVVGVRLRFSHLLKKRITVLTHMVLRFVII